MAFDGVPLLLALAAMALGGFPGACGCGGVGFRIGRIELRPDGKFFFVQDFAGN